MLSDNQFSTAAPIPATVSASTFWFNLGKRSALGSVAADPDRDALSTPVELSRGSDPSKVDSKNEDRSDGAATTPNLYPVFGVRIATRTCDYCYGIHAKSLDTPVNNIAPVKDARINIRGSWGTGADVINESQGTTPIGIDAPFQALLNVRRPFPTSIPAEPSSVVAGAYLSPNGEPPGAPNLTAHMSYSATSGATASEGAGGKQLRVWATSTDNVTQDTVRNYLRIKTVNQVPFAPVVTVTKESLTIFTNFDRSSTYLTLNAANTVASTGVVSVKEELVRVDVLIRKKTESNAPPTGLCVKKADVITFDFNGPARLSAFPLAASTVAWQIWQIKRDGTFTDWTAVPGNGCELDYNTPTGGIFQAKAILTPLDGIAQEYQFIRMKDVPNAANSTGDVQDLHKKDAPDYFGVVDADWQLRVRDRGVANLWSTYYNQNDSCVIYKDESADPNLPKCNVFIYHKCNDAKAIPEAD
jgi:hypothetical protein